MADYKKMYAVLCKTIDEVIDPLEKIPLAIPYVAVLRQALLTTEDMYIESSTTKQSQEPTVIPSMFGTGSSVLLSSDGICATDSE